MKKRIQYFSLIISLLSISLFITSCEEEPPYINFEPTRVIYETTYVDLQNIPTPQPREVLLEDISGVRCVNCPDAAIIISNIKNTFPGRVNSITIHPNTASLSVFTRPITKPGHESIQDFRTEEGGQLLGKLGTPGSLPSGYINRKLFPGKVNRFLERTEWADRVSNELDSAANINIGITGSATAETITTDIELKVINDMNGEYYMSVMLLEDSIVDVQEYQDGASILYDNAYVHKHVLRGIFTAFSGDRLDGATVSGVPVTLNRGRVIKKRFTLPAKPVYRLNQLEVLVLIHRGSDEVVVHSKKIHIK